NNDLAIDIDRLNSGDNFRQGSRFIKDRHYNRQLWCAQVLLGLTEGQRSGISHIKPHDVCFGAQDDSESTTAGSSAASRPAKRPFSARGDRLARRSFPSKPQIGLPPPLLPKMALVA